MAKLWEQLDITGSDSWMEDQKGDINQPYEEYNDVFAINPLELGWTALVKHNIKGIDPKPFKERYCRIPPHQFEKVCKHLKEMEEIGAICRSNSPWASPIVFVKKKDGRKRMYRPTKAKWKDHIRCLQSTLDQRVSGLLEWG